MLSRRSAANVATTALTSCVSGATTGNARGDSVVNDWGTGHTANMAVTAGSTGPDHMDGRIRHPGNDRHHLEREDHQPHRYALRRQQHGLTTAPVTAGKSTTFGYQATLGATGRRTDQHQGQRRRHRHHHPSAALPTMSIADVGHRGQHRTTNAAFTVNPVQGGHQPRHRRLQHRQRHRHLRHRPYRRRRHPDLSPRVTTQTIAVKVTGDTTVEPTETFTVNSPTHRRHPRPHHRHRHHQNDDAANTPPAILSPMCR